MVSQTFRDFEFLIFDDGCTDGSVEIIRSCGDRRIRLIRNGRTMGVTATLNRGFELSGGEYIARMDADDVCLPERFARQVSFLDNHPEVGACGTWIGFIGDREGEVQRYPADPPDIQCAFLFGNSMAHPTLMLRREMFRKAGLRYDPTRPWVEDYDLWVRAARHFPLANIPDKLLLYRLHPDSVSFRKSEEQVEAARAVIREQIGWLGIAPTEEEVALHGEVSQGKWRREGKFLLGVLEWMEKLKRGNDSKGVFPEPAFSAALEERWYAACAAAKGLGWWTWKTFRKASFACRGGIGWKRRFRLAAKCVQGSLNPVGKG
ncbi:MAG: glycosyl transferase family 2 [Deltaproteobacteria bacterium]|nr:glycosyl transferase family 2 [Deltaproteobacteria bacterium]